MIERIKTLFPENDDYRFWVAAALSTLVSMLMVMLGIYAFREYGLALFIVVPFFAGMCSTIFYGLKKGVTTGVAWKVTMLSLGMLSLALLVFGIEGIICLAMALPIVAFLGWLGSLLGYYIVNNDPKKSPGALLILLAFFPMVSFMEKNHQPELTSVVTSIEIDADAEVIWKNVVEFPPLETPTEWLFKTGIAYPTDARIDGAGVGAVRHCNFTTGSFVEPITTWDEPRLLAFDVAEQPAPMKELSFWDIDAPHLHDFFVSKQGQFKLIPLPNGHILLEGTTWYYHNIRPSFYWRWWSDYIIHKIHQRVLEHIKKNAENAPVVEENAEPQKQNSAILTVNADSILFNDRPCFGVSKKKVLATYSAPDSIFEPHYECGFLSDQEQGGEYYTMRYHGFDYTGNDREGYVLEEVDFSKNAKFRIRFMNTHITANTSKKEFEALVRQAIKKDVFTTYFTGRDDAIVFFFENDHVCKVQYWSPC